MSRRNPTDIEHRTATTGIEWRADEDNARKISGYAATYGQRIDLGSFTEEIMSGTFRRALDEAQSVVASYNHDLNLAFARTDAGSLRLRDDDHGLHFEADVPDLSFADDLYKAIEAGIVRGCSFWFRVTGDEWEYSDDVKPHRRITDVDLMELGPVVMPAYSSTSVSARAMACAEESKHPTPEQIRTLYLWLETNNS